MATSLAAVGVSNFGAEQLAGLKAAGLEVPEVNQIELHVWHQQRKVAGYCAKEGIVLMAFCPLARCKQFGRTKLAELAAARGRTEAEMAIRWLLQMGCANPDASYLRTSLPQKLKLQRTRTQERMPAKTGSGR